MLNTFINMKHNLCKQTSRYTVNYDWVVLDANYHKIILYALNYTIGIILIECKMNWSNT